MPDPIMAYTESINGVRLPIYEDERGQYVMDKYGEPVYGFWYIPPDSEECDQPIIVDEKRKPPAVK